MGLTAFPHGVSSFGIPQVGMGAFPYTTTGSVFFVHNSTGSDSPGRGTNPDEPFASLDYAVGRCTANKGDVIFAMPGHTETVTGAAGLAIDVAGISIIGLGAGSLRPTVNYTTAVGASTTISAANIHIENLLFTGGIDALTGPIAISAADVTLQNCEYRDVTGQATDVIVATAGASRLKILNYRHDGATAAGANSAIALTGCDGVVIDGLRVDGDFAVGAVDIRTTAVTDLEVRNVVCRNRNSADICLVDTITGSTGMIGPNIYIRVADHAANITEAITGATFVYFDNIYVVNLAGEKAMLINKTATTDA